MRFRTNRTDTRVQIVCMAERLIKEIGHRKTTVPSIARELRMSSGNVYRFFQSKQNIHDAVARKVGAEVIAAVRGVAASRACSSERLRAALVTVQRLNDRRYAEDRRLHEFIAESVTDMTAVSGEVLGEFRSILAEILADGMRNGEFRRADPERAASRVQCCVASLVLPTLQKPPHEPSLDDLLEFCLAALTNATTGQAATTDASPEHVVHRA